MPRRSLEGRRMHLILTAPQDRGLRAIAAKTGISVSEHCRRAVDFYLSALADRLSTKSRP